MFLKTSSNKLNDNKNFIVKLSIIIIFLVLLLFLYQILNILVILLFALFLNLLFAPFLNFLNKYRIRDWLGIIILYFLLILFILVVFFAVVPIFIKQITLLANNLSDWANSMKIIYETKGINGLGLPSYIESTLIHFDLKELLNSLKDNSAEIGKFVATNLKNFLSNGAGFISTFTGVIFNFVLVFVFSFFIALERKEIGTFFYRILPSNISKYLLSKEELIIKSLSNWLKGQIKLGISIFFITLIGLLILRIFGIVINEFFTLALIAGMMEFIPYIGPFLALLPALALATAFGVKGVIIVFVLYLIIQQIENNFLVPYIMSKSLSLSPFAVLLGMAIGASTFGIIGIIVAIPVVSILQIFITDYLSKKK